MLDAKQIKESLKKEDVIKLMDFLGVKKYYDREDCVIFPTICHNKNIDEASFKLYYYENKHLFVCYTGCDESFDIFGLVLKNYTLNNKTLPCGNTFYGALMWVADFFSLQDSFIITQKQAYTVVRNKFNKKSYEIILKEYNKNVLDVFNFLPTTEWLSEGITEDIMRKYGILYYYYENKIVIPHYDFDGRLVGIRGRALDDNYYAKYMPIKIEKTLYKHPLSFSLYGINENKENIARYKTAIIFEGEKSVLKAENILAKNYSVAACGSSLNKFQVDLLLKKTQVREIIVAFDKEVPKDYNYFDKLYKMCSKYKNLCNISFIYDFNNLLDLKDSPVDKGAEVFNQLLHKRIQVRG